MKTYPKFADTAPADEAPGHPRIPRGMARADRVGMGAWLVFACTVSAAFVVLVCVALWRML